MHKNIFLLLLLYGAFTSCRPDKYIDSPSTANIGEGIQAKEESKGKIDNHILQDRFYVEDFRLINEVHFADVDGDNNSELIKIYKDKVTVSRFDGHQFLEESVFIDIPFHGSVGTFFADVDGDGKADAIAVNDQRINNKITVRKSNGREFLPNHDFTQGPFYGERDTFFADVDGDGKADVIAVNHSGVVIRKSNGIKFLQEEIFINEPFYGSIKTDFADVDGDGMADAIAVNDSTINFKITIRKSNGYFFEPNTDFTFKEFFGKENTVFEDVNGDLKNDVIAVNKNDIVVRFSDGNQFLPKEYKLEKVLNDQEIYFTDINGDEKTDIVFFKDQK